MFFSLPFRLFFLLFFLASCLFVLACVCSVFLSAFVFISSDIVWSITLLYRIYGLLCEEEKQQPTTTTATTTTTTTRRSHHPPSSAACGSSPILTSYRRRCTGPVAREMWTHRGKGGVVVSTVCKRMSDSPSCPSSMFAHRPCMSAVDSFYDTLALTRHQPERERQMHGGIIRTQANIDTY